VRFRPDVMRFEDRTLLSGLSLVAPQLFNPAGTEAVRPNTPVLPYGTPTAGGPTFIDPSVNLINGAHIVFGTKSYVAPYATLDVASGFLKIGTGSAVLDNASITTATGAVTAIGDSVQIGYGATINGAAAIGIYGTSAKPTGIGPNAVIDPGATIGNGSFVGALATIGSGVTVPSGVYVLPGKVVTTNAQASNPALGMVVPITTAIKTELATGLTRDTALAAGYTNLYQGTAATGVSTGVLASITGVENGNIAAVNGISQEAGAATSTVVTGINFEPAKATGPKFIGPGKPSVEGAIAVFKARIIGGVTFNARLVQIQAAIGKKTSIRGDQGQNISFASPPATGPSTTITSPLGGVTISGTTTTTTGAMKFGTNFRSGNKAVILGGTASSYTIGNSVYVGANAVVAGSSLGNNVTIGAGAYVSNSTIAAGTNIAPGEIYISNKVVETVSR
jgi:carbonic anhydrase/acetyltransferase-like protein (isoleucine patch superfamily)